MLEPAMDMVYDADILIVIGTSLKVYPAANLIHFAYNAKKNISLTHIAGIIQFRMVLSNWQ